MSSNVRPPSAVYLAVGDSHAARFDGMITERPDGPAVMKARWLPGLRVNALFRDGKCSEFLTRALRELRFVAKGGDETTSPFPILHEQTGHDSTETVCYKPRFARRLVLLLVAGASDSFDVARAWDSQYDIDLGELMPALDDHPAYDEPRELLPLERACATIEARCQPMFDLLYTLRAQGYPNLFLHDLPPPSWVRLEHWPHPYLRMKVTVLFNEIIRRHAQANGYGFVSIWDEVMDRSGRVRRYDKDGEHLRRATCALSLDRVHHALAAVRADA